MSDELERLRDVARAAEAFLEADGEYSRQPRVREGANEPDRAYIRESYRLWEITRARRDELAAAVARLRELDPPA